MLVIYRVIFLGMFLNGLYHGKGKLVLSDGTVHEGIFKKGIFSGKTKQKTATAKKRKRGAVN